MYDIANEEAARDDFNETMQRAELILVAVRGYDGQNKEDFKKFCFALAGTYISCFAPTPEDFAEIAPELWEYFDRSKLAQFIEKHQV